MKIGFIGAGKVGFTLGKYFRMHGVEVTGYYSRSIQSAKEAADFTRAQAFTNAEIQFTADADYKMMIKKAFEESAENGNVLLVTGSFYLVSEVKQFLENIK